MRIGGLMLLIVCLAAGVVGMYAIAGNLNTSAPVDSAGNTVSNATNLTQQNVTAIAKVAPTAGAVIALIVVAIVLAIVVLYFASVFRRAKRY